MAKKKKIKGKVEDEDAVDFTSDLIKSLNKDHGNKIAYNLAFDESPTHVKRWISTGSKQLDFLIAGRPNGGLPEGRIVEIFGPPSIGKSHIAIQIAVSTQQAGGIVVYIDTENATSVDNLALLGVDISKRFVYVDTHCTEEVLSITEKTILKAKSLQKDVPITIIWDSVAATSPKDELLGDYDKQTIGLQARVISKGMRKITGVIANENVLMVCLNQTRTKIGVMYGDPTTTPGGKAIPFHSSVRIKLGAGQQIKDKRGNIAGINVRAKTIKNKVSAPFRECLFEIHFGKGIYEHEQVFDVLRKHCKEHGPVEYKNMIIDITGAGAWKNLSVTNSKDGTIIEEKKFYKAEFNDVWKSPQYSPYVDIVFNTAFAELVGNLKHVNIDHESYEEIRSVAIELEHPNFVDPEA